MAGESTISAAIIQPSMAMPPQLDSRDHGRKETTAKISSTMMKRRSPRDMGKN